MPYFTAVMASTGRSWRARDVDVSDTTNLEDLADQLRVVAVGEQPVLAVLEHEDEWFALVRVDGDADPRVFVSDLAAAQRSRYGDLLSAAAEVEVDDTVGSAGDDDPMDDDSTPQGGVSGALVGVGGGLDADDGPEGDDGVAADDDGAGRSAGPALGVGGLGLSSMGLGGMGVGGAPDEVATDDEIGAEPAVAVPGLVPWAGDAELLTDLGVGAGVLGQLVEQHGDDPASVLGEVGEACGFDELIEALR